MAPVLPLKRWLQVETIFETACELPRAERAAYVASATAGDSALGAEVSSLLDSGWGEDPAWRDAVQAGAASLAEPEAVGGMRLGPYQVERELGRGGMAVVYLGTRADGEYQKQVAIKLIKRGMDTDAVIGRLRRERRILAGLDHAWIARLLDGGTSADGRPWIVMEYVEGLPALQYCEQRRSSIEQRCALMAKVCDAVGYAHRNLVVHLDLKPGNILVQPDGSPKLLDFGIAKLLAGDAATTASAVAGTEAPTGGAPRPYTPGYASPEQVRGAAVGTATDIYALGVVLFELLTGVRPADGLERASAAVARGGKGKRWARQLAGDLDTIIAKAMRFEPEQRYHSTEHLAADLRRHLAGLPVEARNESWHYRLGKFLGRHRWAAAVGACALGLAATGAGLYLHQARLAARRFDELHHFANAFLFDVDDQLRALPNATSARAVIVQKALGYLNSLAIEERGDTVLQREAGNAWRRVGELQGDPSTPSLGDIAGARASYQKALAMLAPLAAREHGARAAGDVRGDVVAVYEDYSGLERIAGNTDRAEQLIVPALALARQAGHPPPTPALRAELGEVLVSYGWALNNRGRIFEATQSAREAVTLLEGAGPEYRAELADALSVTAGRETRLNANDAAMRHYQRNLELRQQLLREDPAGRIARRNLMLAWAHQADVHADRQSGACFDPAESLADYQQALALARAQVASDASDTTARSDLATCLERVGVELTAVHRPAEAFARQTEALVLIRGLRSAEPGNRRNIENMADIENQSGVDALALGDVAGGRAALRAGIAMFDRVIAADPSNVTDRVLQMEGIKALGDSLASGGLASDHADLATLTRPMPQWIQLMAAQATITRRRAQSAEAWEKLGDWQHALGDGAAARDALRNGLAAWRLIVPLPAAYAPEVARVRHKLAMP